MAGEEVEAGEDMGYPPPCKAAEIRNVESITLLIEIGANVPASSDEGDTFFTLELGYAMLYSQWSHLMSEPAAS